MKILESIFKIEIKFCKAMTLPKSNRRKDFWSVNFCNFYFLYFVSVIERFPAQFQVNRFHCCVLVFVSFNSAVWIFADSMLRFQFLQIQFCNINFCRLHFNFCRFQFCSFNFCRFNSAISILADSILHFQFLFI